LFTALIGGGIAMIAYKALKAIGIDETKNIIKSKKP